MQTDGSLFNGHGVLTFVVLESEGTNRSSLPHHTLHLLTSPSVPTYNLTTTHVNKTMGERTTQCTWFKVSCRS